MGKQSTINEMEQKVREGLKIARESIDDKRLLKLCDDLEYTWETLCANLIIVGVGLSAMKYRTGEQIREQLLKYQSEIQSSKNLRARTVIPDTNLVN